jgi:hypothetical protein
LALAAASGAAVASSAALATAAAAELERGSVASSAALATAAAAELERGSVAGRKDRRRSRVRRATKLVGGGHRRGRALAVLLVGVSCANVLSTRRH